MGKKIITGKMLEDKIEGLLVARKATIDEDTTFKLEQQIRQYAIQYKEVTGNWYVRSGCDGI